MSLTIPSPRQAMYLGEVTREEYKIINMVSARHSVSMVDVETRPPFGITPDQARAIVQRLYDRDILVLDANMRFTLPCR